MTEWPSETPLPSWISNGARPARGVDLLALRAVVQGIGAELLDGITTITPTIRYVGLRAWLARRYALARLPASAEGFQKFAARAESVVAAGTLLRAPNTPGILRQDAIKEMLAASSSAVDVSTVPTPAGGVAAAVYAGPSDQLGVSLPDKSGVPALTPERGLPLHEAVEAILGPTALGRRLSIDPTASQFTLAELQEIGEVFALATPGAVEQKILLEALLPLHPRAGERNRLATYALILELAEEKEKAPRPKDLFELAVAPAPGVPVAYSPWLDGWARYLLRDLVAVVHESVFKEVIEEVQRQGAGAVEGSRVVATLLAREGEIEAALEELGLSFGSGRALDTPLAQVRDALRATLGVVTKGAVRRWSGGLQEEALIRQALPRGGPAALVLLPITWLLAAERIASFSGHGLGERGMSRQGRDRFGLEQVILPGIAALLSRNVTFREAASELTWRTVEQHLTTAWSRVAARPTVDVACLVADGTRWTVQTDFAAGRSLDRVSRAIGWTQQLGLVGAKGLTVTGEKVLERLRSQLSAAEVAQ